MSDEPKTLTLTLEEAMRLLDSEGWRLVAVPAWRRTTAHSWELEIKLNWLDGFATWPEAVSFALGVPVVARDEAAVESFCSKCGWAGQATAPDYRHDGCNYSAGPVSDWKLYAAQREAAELRAALRTLVTDLEALMEESHLSLYDGDGALVGTSWGKVLQGGKDEYLSNWRDAKRLAGGEEQE